MRLFKTYCFLFLFIFFLIPVKSMGQANQPNDSLKLDLTKAAMEMISSARTCTLITLDQQGRPRARLMDVLIPEEDFVIWMGTNPKSRKVAQIKHDSRVTLSYIDQDGSGYVTIYGKAQIVNDLEEKQRHWKAEWKEFYKDKQNGFVLIKVSPEWMEIVSNSRGIYGDPVTWKPNKVVFDTIR